MNYLCFDEYTKFILSDYVSILKKWRKDNNLNVRKAAITLGIPSSTYSSWEREIYGISKENYYKLKKNKTF